MIHVANDDLAFGYDFADSSEGDSVADSNSTEYYQSRERQERVRAEAANDPAVIAIHLEMAERYAKLARRSARGMKGVLNRVM